MSAIITLAEAKIHLHITGTAHDADVQAAIDAADAAVRKYLKSADDPTWDDTTTPADIKHAVKVATAHYYDNRGDDMQERDARAWEAIHNLVRMWRDPALA